MEKENFEPVETLTPLEAGRILGKNQETIRAGLRQSRFPFGTAIPPEQEGGNWNYIIIKSKFLEYAGITNERGKKKMPGKHSREAVENKKLQEIIARRDKEIKDIKTECAEQFKMIKDLCFINEYNNKNIKLKKIYEIASDNFSALVKDIVINETDETAKIIELPNTDQSK